MGSLLSQQSLAELRSKGASRAARLGEAPVEISSRGAPSAASCAPAPAPLSPSGQVRQNLAADVAEELHIKQAAAAQHEAPLSLPVEC